jgi:Arc/MetJ family transcription regulator
VIYLAKDRFPAEGLWRQQLVSSPRVHARRLDRSHGDGTEMSPMRTNIEIDDALMREAQKASGHATKKQTVEEALRLMIRMRQQHEVDAAFSRYRWRGNLARSRRGRGSR